MTFTCRGWKHVECGKESLVPCEDEVRLRCESCEAEETWEQSARRLFEVCGELYARAAYFEDVEKMTRKHIHALGFGHLLSAGIPSIGDAKVEERQP